MGIQPRGIVQATNGRIGPFPRMDGVLSGWQNAMLFRKVTDAIVNFENTKVTTDFPFEGVFQPMPPRQIFFKPEGQRDWKFWTLWTRTDYGIVNGDLIQDFKGTTYKIMKSTDWGQGGYFEFELLEDYQTAP